MNWRLRELVIPARRQSQNPAPWRQKNIALLEFAAKPHAVLLLMVAAPVESLVQATRTQWREKEPGARSDRQRIRPAENRGIRRIDSPLLRALLQPKRTDVNYHGLNRLNRREVGW